MVPVRLLWSILIVIAAFALTFFACGDDDRGGEVVRYASEFTAVEIDPGAPATLQLAVQACAGLYNRELGGSIYIQMEAHDEQWLDELDLEPNDVVNAQGEREGRHGSQNNWVIHTVGDRDVVVVDLFGKVKWGTFVGDNLSTAVRAQGGAGLVLDGGIRDTIRVYALPDINVFCRGFDPTPIRNVTLLSLNGPTRIGQATCLPGDVVLGTRGGVIFIPPHLVEEVVTASEDTRIRDQFGQQRLREGKYTSGQIDVSVWEDHIEADFQEWLKARRG